MSKRLQIKTAPRSLNMRFGDPAGLSHGATTPMGLCRGLSFNGLLDHRGHSFIFNRSGSARTQLIIQRFNTSFDETTAPLAHTGPRHAHLCTDMDVVHPGGRQENNLCALYLSIRQTRGGGKTLQLFLLRSITRRQKKWRPVGDLNPCCRDENPVS